MNRRTSLKSILTLGFLGISSISIYKWAGLNKEVTLDNILPFKELISELAETIIPKTETPGAKDASVENYIIRTLLDCHDRLEQNKFVDGLLNLEEYTKNKYKKSFLKCNSTERISILSYFENKETYALPVLNKINNKFLGKPFFTQLKSLTIEGYCQSEIGATQGLAYDYIPGNYEACIPLNHHQKSWATK